jgi:hypothetical protein
VSLLIVNTIKVGGSASQKRVGINTDNLSELTDKEGNAHFKYTYLGHETWYLVEESYNYVLNNILTIPAVDIALPATGGVVLVNTGTIGFVYPHVTPSRCYLDDSVDRTIVVHYRLEEVVALVNSIPQGGSGEDTDAIHDDISGEINAIANKGTPVSGDKLIIEDSADGYAKKSVNVGDLPTAGGGEANTGSNQGLDGVGVYDTKQGIDLQFRNIAPANNKVTVSLNGKDIDIGVTEPNINHDNLSNFVGEEHINWTSDQGGTYEIHSNNLPAGIGGTPVYVFIKTTGQSEGDLHLSDGTN